LDIDDLQVVIDMDKEGFYLLYDAELKVDEDGTLVLNLVSSRE